MKLNHLNSIIFETTFFKGRLGLFKDNDDIIILKNPSSRALKGLMNKCKDVRGLYTWHKEIPELYFWDAERLNHYGFFQKFGFGDDDGDINFILSKDKILFPDWMVHPEENGITSKYRLDEIEMDIETITQDRVISSLYPNGIQIGVSY